MSLSLTEEDVLSIYLSKILFPHANAQLVPFILHRADRDPCRARHGCETSVADVLRLGTQSVGTSENSVGFSTRVRPTRPNVPAALTKAFLR